jgi:hypothetical protein
MVCLQRVLNDLKRTRLSRYNTKAWSSIIIQYSLLHELVYRLIFEQFVAVSNTACDLNFFTEIIFVAFCFQILDAFPFFFNLRFFGIDRSTKVQRYVKGKEFRRNPTAWLCIWLSM